MYLELVEPEVVNKHEMIVIKAFILFYNYASENLSANYPQHSPYSFISSAADKDNLSNNQELLKFMIISFILVT